MDSKNNLLITGVIVTNVTIFPERRSGRFTLAHYFGGQKPPLLLKCVFYGRRVDEFLSINLHKGDRVTVTAFLRPHNQGIEAVIRNLTVNDVHEEPPMVFELLDSGRSYTIPAGKCIIDDFKVDGNTLILSTGKKVLFLSEDGARTAWYLLQECFSEGFKHLFFQECCMCYGMD